MCFVLGDQYDEQNHKNKSELHVVINTSYLSTLSCSVADREANLLVVVNMKQDDDAEIL